jgi:hypothetical protein
VKLVTIYCDRCGGEADAGRTLVVIHAGPTPPTWPTDPENGRPTLDLYGPCLDGSSVRLRDPAAGDGARGGAPGGAQ